MRVFSDCIDEATRLNAAALAGYSPQVYPGRITVFAADGHQFDPAVAIGGKVHVLEQLHLRAVTDREYGHRVGNWLAMQTVTSKKRCNGRARTAVRDLPIAGRPTVLMWSKRRWRCPDPDCAVSTWSETSEAITRQSGRNLPASHAYHENTNNLLAAWKGSRQCIDHCRDSGQTEIHGQCRHGC